MERISTPVRPQVLRRLLTTAKYDEKEIEFLVDGFTQGFSIGYEGTTSRQSNAKNIPFIPGVRDKFDMWQKIMKEVKEGRVAGPFRNIPFPNYIQSPVGLVPKAGNKTRLIFHLSYKFSDSPEGRSLNECTPKNICTTHYNDLDYAVTTCLNTSGKQNSPVYLAKSDLVSAFRMLPIKREHWRWLIFKADNPLTRETVYFVDKCLPFGASISCSHYQRFSNGLRRIAEFITGKQLSITNYLDDFLFVEKTESACNQLVRTFLNICSKLGVPVSADKMEWAAPCITFLGILLDSEHLTINSDR